MENLTCFDLNLIASDGLIYASPEAIVGRIPARTGPSAVCSEARNFDPELDADITPNRMFGARNRGSFAFDPFPLQL
jgi:hypothetical protein